MVAVVYQTGVRFRGTHHTLKMYEAALLCCGDKCLLLIRNYLYCDIITINCLLAMYTCYCPFEWMLLFIW